ncbi:hypothetical protein FGG08_003918 [Glutinoglossum americanum]|uniref:Cytochrome b561 domain-containing protein n=1 Tax=Glutinoglossum americanum TaxID=1670608 RepID=A0A9P8L309_9PEZI|nr:hypothetical protein FGG08_003918 [Glutinoglossum americanum]
MKGALMFIIYGDPSSEGNPTISIRTATGHKQPEPITASDAGGADIRVLRSSWIPSSEGPTLGDQTFVATVSLICYSCHLWPGTQITAASNSMPWMWAWNEKQDIPMYSDDIHLDMHRHHAGAGGWGNFYVDMARSVNTARIAPSLPPIRPNVAAIGVSESPGSLLAGKGALEWIAHDPTLHLHGLIMGMAFLLLFPAGVVAMRSGSAKSFKYHWIIQLAASVFTGLGVIAGLLLGQGINTTHQGVGIAIAASLGLQGVLGWRHHVVFLRIKRRTWISHAHVWLGRLVMAAGWTNLVTGMLLRGYPGACVIVMVIVVCVEMLGLTFWVWWAYRRSAPQMPSGQRSVWRKEENYFAVGDLDDEGDDDSELNTVTDETMEPMIEAGRGI